MNKAVKYLSILAILAVILGSSAAKAQVGIGTASPDASAQLEIVSNSKGVLIPRMTTYQRSSIANPATGLLVYQTDNTPGFYFYNNGQWQRLVNNTELSTGGGVPTTGNTLLNGTGNPYSTLGNNGDFYINTTTYTLFGPKAGGIWPSTGISMVGSGTVPQSVTSPGGTITIGNGTNAALAPMSLELADKAVTASKVANGAIKNEALDKDNIPLSGFGSAISNVSMGGFKLTNLASPTNGRDAATKKYVDDQLTSSGGSYTPVLSLDAAQNLSIRGGNAVSLADLYQSLSLAGTVLSISGPRDSHVDLAGLLAMAGGGTGSGGLVVHDATLTGNGVSGSALGLANQGITPLKLSGITGNGTSGQVLTSNGSGAFTWADAATGGGGITAINTADGLTNSGTSTINLGISDNGISLGKLAVISNMTILGNNSGGTAAPVALSMAQLKAMLSINKTDVGLGNVQNVDQTNASNLTSGTISSDRFGNATIPATAIIGDGNTSHYLRGDGVWAVMPGGTSGSTTLEGLTDVSVSAKNANDLLSWDAASSKWKSKTFGELIPLATTGSAGLLSPADKTKLDGLKDYTLPIASDTKLGGIKVGPSLTVDGAGILNIGGTIGDVTGVTAGTGLTGGGLTGDVTLSLATIPNNTILGNNSGAEAVPSALNATQIKTLLALENVKNVDQTNANNLLTGTIPTPRYGSLSIPLTALNTSGTATATTYLRGDGSWGALSASALTGIVPVANGGTGIGSYTPGNYINAGNATTLQQRTPAEVKQDLGLNEVNNTSDADKPISTATQTALNGKEDVANKSNNVINDAVSTTKYPSVSAIKTYVDNTINAAVISAGGVPLATTTEPGKIQLAGDLGGSGTAPTVPGLALKEPLITNLPVTKGGTGITAYTPGYYINALTATTLQQRSPADVKKDLSLEKVENTSDAEKPVSDATVLELNKKVNILDGGKPLGYTPLDAAGKIEEKYLPSSLLGAVNYQGTYNAASGSPALPPAVDSKGDYYVVTNAGTLGALNLTVGDWVISNGVKWDKVASSSSVASVFGRTGTIIAGTGDYNTGQVTETTNLYYTENRVTTHPVVAAHTTALTFKEDVTNKSSDGTLASNSTTKYTSERAVKTYVDTRVPLPSVANANKVLTINSSGATEWAAASGGGTGTVTSVTGSNANGVNTTVATSTTTPVITVALGDIKPTSIVTSGTITASNFSGTTSGTNTGDQTITLNGDITGTGTGTFTTTIGANKVTYAKMQAMTAGKLLGSGASGTAVSEITLGTGLSFNGTTLNATATGTGTVTNVSVVAANGVSGTVANSTTAPAITLTLGDIKPTSVVSTGVVTGSNISGTAVNTGDQTITLSGDVTGSGTGPITASIGTGKVTSSHIADGTITSTDIAAQTIKSTNLSAISTFGTSGQVLTSNGSGGFSWGSATGTGDMNKTTYDPAGISQQVVGLTATQTLTNKTLTSPIITNPSGLVKANVGLSLVDNTADANKNVWSATKLTTARKINGISFDGTADITIPVSVSGDPNLNAVSILATTGLMTRTGSGAITTRSITNGPGINVTYGDGVSGNPTISLANTTVTSGTYNAATITVDSQGRITAASNGSGGGGATDLTYTSSATQGIVNSSTGTDATIPAGSTANASLMLPGDKLKLDKIADLTSTSANKVLTANGDGTAATWVTPAAGGGSTGGYMIYSPADPTSSLGSYGISFLKVKASGPGITIQRTQGATPGGIPNKFILTVPADITLESIRMNGDNVLLGKTQTDTPPGTVYVEIVYASSSNRNTGLDDFWPPVSHSFINRTTAPWKYGAPGAPGQAIAMVVNGYTNNVLSLQWTININAWTMILSF